MPPGILVRGKGLHHALELGGTHVLEIIMVHNGSTSRVGAAQDVAACRLDAVFTVDAVAQIDGGVWAKRGRHALRRRCRPAGQTRHEVRPYLRVLIISFPEELLEHLERVGAVAAAAGGQASGS